MRQAECYEERSDEQLMEEFYAGRRDAFGILSDRLRLSLQRQAFSQLPTGLPGRRHAAEDLAEDALVRVLETFRNPLRRWRTGGAKLRTWLGTILRNLVVSYLRRAHRERLFGGWSQETADGYCEPFEETISDWRLDAERQALAADELHQQFLVALDRLPEQERSIVKMRMQGETYRIIGSCHGMAASTAMRREEAAQQAIRDMVAA